MWKIVIGYMTHLFIGVGEDFVWKHRLLATMATMLAIVFVQVGMGDIMVPVYIEIVVVERVGAIMYLLRLSRLAVGIFTIGLAAADLNGHICGVITVLMLERLIVLRLVPQ
mgnify:CR=1 FL=1